MKFVIEWLYQMKNSQVRLTSEKISGEKALQLSLDFEKTGRVKELTFIDDLDTRWTKKELIKFLKEVETEPHEIIVYFDGGYDKYSKEAGLGCVIYFRQNNKKWRKRHNRKIDEIESNNEAEYAAFWFVMQVLEEMGVRDLPVEFYGDSQVVLNQLAGDWPCFEEEFNRWLDRIENKMEQLGITPTYSQISRKDNKEADQLANQALKGINVTSQIEMNDEVE